MRLFCSPTSPFGRVAHIALREKGFDFELVMVDPWADDPSLQQVNPATRVPALVLDDGTVLTESLLIVQWLERLRPAPPLFTDARQLQRAGLAIAVIESAAHTVMGRRAVAPAPFDETAMGLRRRRGILRSLQQLEQSVRQDCAGQIASGSSLDAITAVVAQDYLQLRFAGAPWLVPTPALDAWLVEARQRPSYLATAPH